MRKFPGSICYIQYQPEFGLKQVDMAKVRTPFIAALCAGVMMVSFEYSAEHGVYFNPLLSSKPASITFVQPGDFVVPEDIAKLPNMKGWGGFPDLHYAAAQDEVLHKMIRNLVIRSYWIPFAEYRKAAEAIVIRWAGASDIDKNGRGAMNARHVAVLEKAWGAPAIRSAPLFARQNIYLSVKSRDFYQPVYEKFIDDFTARLIVQTYRSWLQVSPDRPNKPYAFDGHWLGAFSTIGYDMKTGRVFGGLKKPAAKLSAWMMWAAKDEAGARHIFKLLRDYISSLDRALYGHSQEDIDKELEGWLAIATNKPISGSPSIWN